MHHGFKVCRCACYIGGFVGDDESKRDWLKKRMVTWEWNIRTISKTAVRYPKEIHAAVVQTMQSDWIFLQRITKNTVDGFAGVEKILRKTFLHRLFFDKAKILSPIVVSLSAMPVNKSGLGLLDPLISANERYLS